ncbi:MAG: hypothetical protein JWQ72_2754 [Polaromonas sp.]|nr:hypothetical protein [Polaromonas sp.]
MMARKARGAAIATVLAFSACMAGCAAGLAGSGGASPFRNPEMTLQAAADAVLTGASTRDEVRARLGGATVIRFDSGYEVWVYRSPSRGPPETRAELVILLTPEGLVRKKRLRAASSGAL